MSFQSTYWQIGLGNQIMHSQGSANFTLLICNRMFQICSQELYLRQSPGPFFCIPFFIPISKSIFHTFLDLITVIFHMELINPITSSLCIIIWTLIIATEHQRIKYILMRVYAHMCAYIRVSSISSSLVQQIQLTPKKHLLHFMSHLVPHPRLL